MLGIDLAQASKECKEQHAGYGTEYDRATGAEIEVVGECDSRKGVEDAQDDGEAESAGIGAGQEEGCSNR